MKWTRKMQLLKFILGALLGLLTYGFLNFDQELAVWPALLSIVVGAVIVLIIHTISRLLDKSIPWKKHTGLRLLGGVIMSSFLGVIIVRIIYYEIGYNSFLKVVILIFTYAILYNIIYFIFYSYHEFARGQVRQQEFETKQTQLQLDALKSQLSPHFLFNSLNALSSLFHKDLRDAERFIRSLGSSYKYVLEQYEHPLVSVRKELEFTKSYFEMMKLRFGDGLELKVDVGDDILHMQIPPLSLQMLVENAVKHNRTDTSEKLKIEISFSESHLIVTNNKIVKSYIRDSTEIGLKNISDRFDLLLGKTIKVEDSHLFKVQIPVVI